jgi:hypothetical protein
MVLILIVRVRTAWARRAQPVSPRSFARQHCAVPKQRQLEDNLCVYQSSFGRSLSDNVPDHSGKSTMRAVLAILIVALVLIVAAIASGYLNIRQIRGGSAPAITATRNSVSASGGKAPAFDVETGSVKVGTKETTVKVPTLKVQKPQGNTAAATTNSAM